VVLLLASVTPSGALDARDPDPVSVVAAAFAAHNVGNVEAATAFYTEDAVITSTRGRPLPPGKDSIRRYVESNRAANVQFGLGQNPRVEDKKVLIRATTSIEFFEKVGLGPVEVGNVVIVDGNRIKSLTNYYPLRAVDRIDQACRAHPEVPFFGRPCSEFVDGARTHTTRLIADGIVAAE